jgi:hypothetical protein
MDWLIDLSWREYPASALLFVGLTLLLYAVGKEMSALRRDYREPGRVLDIVQAFRLTVLGLVLAGFAAAWQWQIDWLALLALAIGIVELLESSVMIYALRHTPPPYRAARTPDSGLAH